jgi:fructose-1,6-bisphosphatase/inositol monophosphatase family enzyme
LLPDIDKVSELIRAVAAAEIVPRFRSLAEGETWEKKPGSVVTVADQAAERALTLGLEEIMPGSTVVGEEAVADNPELLHRINGKAPAWIVDPVDGTRNFAAGETGFAVIIALVMAGETRAGWIYRPTDNTLATAVLGGGARVDGRRVRVANGVAVQHMTGSLGARLRRNKEFSGRFKAVTDTKCCAVDYLAIITGRIHFAYYRNLMPWDHAAGQLMHREAGGYSACLDGADYHPGKPAEGGLLLTPDAKNWELISTDIPEALAASK